MRRGVRGFSYCSNRVHVKWGSSSAARDALQEIALGLPHRTSLDSSPVTSSNWRSSYRMCCRIPRCKGRGAKPGGSAATCSGRSPGSDGDGYHDGQEAVEALCQIWTQPFTYVIFGILIGPVFILWIYNGWTRPGTTNWPGAVASGALLVGIWLWFFFLEVDLYSDRLVFKSLFGKREVAYSEIRKTEITERHFRGAIGRAWAIYDAARFATRALKIPIGPFSVRDQRRIAETLVEKATIAHLDSWTRSVASHAQ